MHRRHSRIAALVVAAAVFAAPAAHASHPATTVVTDPAGDTDSVVPVMPSDPRADLLQADIADTASDFVVTIEVDDLYAPSGGESVALSWTLWMEYSSNHPVAFYASRASGAADSAEWRVTGQAEQPVCRGNASVVFDDSADTITITAGKAMINNCPALAGDPYATGDVIADWDLASTWSDTSLGVPLGGGHDAAQSNTSYTISH
jgi:hypothetical protein